MLAELEEFDARKDNIRSWFSKYKVHAETFAWTDEQRIDSLSFFLDPGLMRVVQSGAATSLKVIESRLSEFVDDLLFIHDSNNSHNHITKMIDKFNQFKFSKEEKRFWLNCLFPEESIRKYYRSFAYGHPNKSYYDYVLSMIIG